MEDKWTDDKIKIELDKMLIIEKYHVAKILRDKNNNIVYAQWCPKWLNPDIPGAKGGIHVGHHICRKCKRVCLHLFGVPFTHNRWCLKCDGANNVPKWYFHNPKTCFNCANFSP